MTFGPTVTKLERGGEALATDVVGSIPETTLVVCVELAQLLQELRRFQDWSCKPQSTTEAGRSAVHKAKGFPWGENPLHLWLLLVLHYQEKYF